MTFLELFLAVFAANLAAALLRAGIQTAWWRLAMRRQLGADVQVFDAKAEAKKQAEGLIEAMRAAGVDLPMREEWQREDEPDR